MGISVIILAAGAGTRMKSATPKVLHKICGKEMIFYSIDCALQISDDVHIVLFHQAKLIQESILKAYQNKKDCIFFHIQDHENFPGTGGALMNGKVKNGQVVESSLQKMPFSCLENEVLILNGDMPLVKSSSLKGLVDSKEKVAMSILELENPFGYGRVVIKDNKIIQIIEQKDADSAQQQIKSVNAGVYKIHTDILKKYLPLLENNNAQSEFYLTDIIAKCVRDNIKIDAIFVEEKEYMGVNSKLHLAQAQEIMLDSLRNNAMEQGVIMHLPHTIYLESSVTFSGECILEQGVQISGASHISNSHIKAHSVIESSIIESSDIGPLAHIRPKCHIKNTHIGNFVETKSAILDSAKAGHLSYLGDCEIQSGSNIGAGVITCNYDGKTKHKTRIGKNVFVGSDVQLVAPVNLADNCIIGAGSTITKDVESGELAICRATQKNIKDGFYKIFTKK